ncbi:11339_t:CDS:1, partial [Scutellospora calospora]
EKATFTSSLPKPKIHSKNENALILDIPNMSNIASNDIVAALAAKLGGRLNGSKISFF